MGGADSQSLEWTGPAVVASSLILTNSLPQAHWICYVSELGIRCVDSDIDAVSAAEIYSSYRLLKFPGRME